MTKRPLRQVRERLRPLSAMKTTPLTCALDASGDFVRFALDSYSELREAPTNMVINACEVVHGNGAIEVCTRSRENRVEILVSDTGSGMPPEVAEKVFPPFSTTKDSTHRPWLERGSGHYNKAQWHIRSGEEECKGTTIPISAPPATGDEDLQEKHMTDAPETSRPANVLIIEDEPLIRETLSDMLSLARHRVTLAGNGEDGLRLFHESDYDIVFTDLGMPGLSGWEVARAVKEINGEVPVVMVTGWGVGMDDSDVVASGVDEILPKPFDIDHVLALVQRLMEGR